ncbi:hypothetical protein Leryth_019662, partial [Lithospermum erythrorhizon]
MTVVGTLPLTLVPVLWPSLQCWHIIWFAYTAGQESVVELESIEDLSSCNLSSPIKMYTDGLNEVQLDGEGTRFFASGNFESCKKGLKIHVNVHPKVEDLSQNDGHLETNDEGGDSQAPESSSPTPKPKPKRPPPPPDAGPDDDDPPLYPLTPKPHPPPPSCSTMLDGRFFSMVLLYFYHISFSFKIIDKNI